MVTGIVFYGLALALLAFSFFTDKAKTGQALRKAWKSLEGILPQFLGIIVLIGILLAAVALIAYAVTLSPGACPGESAGLIVQYAGLFPKLKPDHPLWGALVWTLSRGPADHLALRLNWLSALCGAGSVYLLYRIMVGAIYGTITVTPVNRAKALIAARLAGVSAALLLAFSVPFWVVSNRAHPATFDLLLLLAVTWLFSLHATKRSEEHTSELQSR